MAKNYIQPGVVITLLATAAVASGDLVVEGALVGVALSAAELGEDFEMQTSGVFSLPKKAATAVGQGVRVYWDSTGEEVTTTATDNTLIGCATLAAASSDTMLDVRLSN